MEPTAKKLNEDRSIPLAAKCKPMILVSKNMKYMRIFMWVFLLFQTIRSWTQDLPHFACLLTYEVGSYSCAHQREGWRHDSLRASPLCL